MKKDLILLLLLILPAIAWLVQPGFFPMHDDLQAMRQLQMDKCFKDLQIPCRWISDMGYGYGYPLFNYYPPLPYYLGQPLRWLGFQFVDIVKIIGIIGFVASAITMYLLTKEFWGRLGGLVSAAFYIYAPYHSVDFYVRAAVNEFWALVFFPAIFWTSYRLIKENNSKWILWLSLSVAGLMLSHNPMLMIFTPLFIGWIFFWWWRFKSLKSFKYLFISALWSFGLAAFFTLPVVFETKYVSVWTLTSGYFNYLAHFLDVNQIFFNINWGYGESVYGRADTMSFAIGYLHWIIPAIILLLTPFVKKFRNNYQLILISSFYFLMSLFMAHFKATPIWQAIKPLEFLQFPWRFLTLSIFTASFLSGALALIFSRRLLLLSCSLALLLLLNANYFRPRDWWPQVTDKHKFSGKLWQLQLTSGIFDYLPIWAPLPPADPPVDDLVFTTGEGKFKLLQKKTNRQTYQVEVTTSKAIVELQTYYFPGWRVWADNKEVPIDPGRDPLLGRMQVDLSEGKHHILARFTNTPVRSIGNTISLFAWAAAIGIMTPWPKKSLLATLISQLSKSGH